jgi:hypothetical protein
MMKDNQRAALLARLWEAAYNAAPPLPLPACGEREVFRKLKVATQSLRSGLLARNLRDERANCDLSSQAGRGEAHTTCDRAQAGELKENAAVTGQRRPNRQATP